MLEFNKKKGISVTLPGGGMAGPALLGFIDLLEEEKVVVSEFTCVSIGTIIGAFYTNNYSTDAIARIFVEELSLPGPTSMLEDLARFASALSLFMPPVLDPRRLLGGGFIDLLPLMTELVRKYKLVPNDRLQILASTALREPKLYKGRHYDLARAKTASTCVPGFMRPPVDEVDGARQLLFDGGVYHLQPGEFGGPVAIIAKLFDFPAFYKDRPGDFITHVGKPGSPVFAKLTAKDVADMREYGYTRARKDLAAPLRQGLIPTSK
jgi:hypothetical protein